MANSIDIGSVAVYLSVFIVSLFFVAISEHYLYKKNGTLVMGQNRIIAYFFLFMALLLPCLLAAYRGMSVGFDVSGYIINNFQFRQNNKMNFLYYWENMPTHVELLFALILYLSSSFNCIQLTFLIIELLILLPLVIIMVKERGKGSLIIEFTLFYFLFYNFSLSGMRQSIAMSVLVCAFFLATEKKYNKSFFLCIIASLFHSSTIIITSLIIFCLWINKLKRRKLFISLFASFLLVMIILFPLFVDKISSIASIVNPRYGFYITYYFHSGFQISDVPFTDMILKTAIMCIPLTLIGKIKKFNEVDRLLLIFVFLGRYFVLFNGIFFESLRVAYYFDYFLIFYISRMIANMPQKNSRIVCSLLIVFLCVLYWTYFIMYIGGWGTNIFSFNF